jgi:fatty acid desaturase
VTRAAETSVTNRKDATMLWTILLILLVLWVLGLIGSIGGAAIHLLLVLAAVVLIAQLLSGRRAV